MSEDLISRSRGGILDVANIGVVDLWTWRRLAAKNLGRYRTVLFSS